MKIDKKWSTYLAALSLPLSLMVWYFCLHRRYPFGDAADYARGGLWAYQKYRSDGLISSLVEIYRHRIWKPVFHPALALPALIATGGDIRISVALVNLILFFIFLSYTAKLSRIFLSPLHTIIATWFVGTLPWVISSASIFNGELPFMTSGTAALYYLYKCDYFQVASDSVSLGICLGFMFIFQPFVAGLDCGFVLLIYICRAVTLGKLQRKDLIMTFPVILVMAFLFDYQCRHTFPWVFPWKSFNVGLVVLGLWLMFWRVMLRRWRLSGTFYASFSVGFGIFYAWCGAFLESFYNWLDISTFSTSAFGFWVKPVQGDFFSRAGGAFDGYFLPIVLLFGLVGFAFLYISSHPLPLEAKWQGVLIPLVLFPLIVGSLTQNHDPRYYYLSITVLFLFSTINALQSGKHIAQRIFRTLFSFGAFLSIALAMSNLFSPAFQFPDKAKYFFNYGRYDLSPTPTPEPATTFTKEVCRLAELRPMDRCDVALLINGLSKYNPDVFETTIIGLEKRINFSMEVPWIYSQLPEVPGTRTPIQAIKESFDLIVINMDKGQYHQPLDPVPFRVSNLLLNKFEKGKISDLGLDVVGEFELHEPREKFLVLKTNRRKAS